MSRDPSLVSVKLAFVGGGNMARCLLGGALGAGVTPDRIRIGEPQAAQRARLEAEFGVRCTPDNREAVEGADIVVVAVKPQVAADTAAGLAGALAPGTLVISIMAGIRRDDLRRWLGDGPLVLRTMPNTPALVGLGITVLHAAPDVGATARARADALLGAVGETVWTDDEGVMDAVTAVSGSGPAYLFLVLEALEAAAVESGLPAGTARRLALQTVRGAAEMAVRADVDAAELRRQVTSPGGTTEAALAELEAGGLRRAFSRAVAAATARSRELADEFGKRRA